MKHRFSIFIVLAFAITAVYGCKEDTIVKARVAPGNNILNVDTVSDSLTVITKTTFVDTLNTSSKITGFRVIHALGTIVDPFFGRTTTGIYFQVLPPVNEFTFSSGSYTIDSAVLILPYIGFSWGDTANPQSQGFNVYQLDERMRIETTYYSNQKLPFSGQPINEPGLIDLKYAINNKPVILGDTADRHLRIKLKQSFIDDVNSRIGSSTFQNGDNFLDYFKGFFVTPADTTKSTDLLPYISLDGDANYKRLAIAFYIRENGSNETKAIFFNYDREKTANYNWITRNYNGTPAKSIIDRYQATINQSDDTVILQGDPGAIIDVRIPHIENLPVASIVKAELVITRIGGSAGDTLSPPTRLIPYTVDASGRESAVQDFGGASGSNSAAAFVDGVKRTEKDANGNDIIRYRINIPRELQKAIIDKRNELHLHIKGSVGFPAAYRLIAGGRTNSTYKLQMNIVYSKPN